MVTPGIPFGDIVRLFYNSFKRRYVWVLFVGPVPYLSRSPGQAWRKCTPFSVGTPPVIVISGVAAPYGRSHGPISHILSIVTSLSLFFEQAPALIGSASRRIHGNEGPYDNYNDPCLCLCLMCVTALAPRRPNPPSSFVKSSAQFAPSIEANPSNLSIAVNLASEYNPTLLLAWFPDTE